MCKVCLIHLYEICKYQNYYQYYDKHEIITKEATVKMNMSELAWAL